MVLDDNLKSEIINAHNKAVSETLKEIEDKEIETRITTNRVIERVKRVKWLLLNLITLLAVTKICSCILIVLF